MDEPLCCCRKEIHQSDDYAVRETANYIALVRKHYPPVLIGEIEPYPFLSFDEHRGWIDALEKRLAEMKVRGLDFYRLDVNWIEFNVQSRGSWRQEVRQVGTVLQTAEAAVQHDLLGLGLSCPRASRTGGRRHVVHRNHAAGLRLCLGRRVPDQIVVQSSINAPGRSLPETAEYTFARTVLDFTRRFAQVRK